MPGTKTEAGRGSLLCCQYFPCWCPGILKEKWGERLDLQGGVWGAEGELGCIKWAYWDGTEGRVKGSRNRMEEAASGSPPSLWVSFLQVTLCSAPCTSLVHKSLAPQDWDCSLLPLALTSIWRLLSHPWSHNPLKLPLEPPTYSCVRCKREATFPHLTSLSTEWTSRGR